MNLIKNILISALLVTVILMGRQCSSSGKQLNIANELLEQQADLTDSLRADNGDLISSNEVLLATKSDLKKSLEEITEDRLRWREKAQSVTLIASQYKKDLIELQSDFVEIDNERFDSTQTLPDSLITITENDSIKTIEKIIYKYPKYGFSYDNNFLSFTGLAGPEESKIFDFNFKDDTYIGFTKKTRLLSLRPDEYFVYSRSDNPLLGSRKLASKQIDVSKPKFHIGFTIGAGAVKTEQQEIKPGVFAGISLTYSILSF
jgi:hypothetical protein